MKVPFYDATREYGAYKQKFDAANSYGDRLRRFYSGEAGWRI
jgi:hypothetical protein